MKPEENKKETISKALHDSFEEGVNKGEQEAEKILRQLKKVKTDIEKVSLAAHLRGLANEIDNIDSRYKEQLENVKKEALEKKQSNKYISLSKDELSEKANKKIQNRSNNAVEKREKNANKVLRTTAFLSKGMRLVGAKKTSEKIQNGMGNFTKRYIEKDSAVLRITNSMIESGDLLKTDVDQVIEAAIRGARNIVTEKKQAMSDIDKSADERHQKLDVKANNKEADEKNARKKAIKSGKNEKVHYGLEKSAKNMIRARKSVAHGIVKLSTLSEKAVSLVGAKGLAEEMKQNSQSYAERLVEKDASIISFTKRMIRMGEISKENVNQVIRETKQNLNNRVNEVRSVKDSIDKKSNTLENKVARKKHSEVKKEMRSNVYGEKTLLKKDAEKIKNVQDKSIDRRLAIAQGFLKVTGLPVSVARLVGSKETANRLESSSYKVAKKLVEKDPTMAKFAVRMMKSGFITKEQVKQGMNYVSEEINRKKSKVVEKVVKVPEKVETFKNEAKKKIDTRVGKIKKGTEDVILDVAEVGESVWNGVKDVATTVETAIYSDTIDAARFVKNKTLGIAADTTRVGGIITGFSGKIIQSATQPLKEEIQKKGKKAAEKGIDVAINGLGATGKGISYLKGKFESLKEKINSSHNKSENELGLVAAKNTQNPERTQAQKDADMEK